MSFKSLLRFVGMRQNSKPEMYCIRVEVSATTGSYATDGIIEGVNYATVRKNGTGDYNVKLNDVSRRNNIVVGIVPHDVCIATAAFTPTTDGVVEVYLRDGDDGITDVDVDFDITIMSFKSATQR